MAVVNQVPRLAADQQQLERYLRVRDTGEPTAVPSPAALEQTAAGDPVICEQDVISWGFSETPLRADSVGADGFVVYIEEGSTTDPIETQIDVSIDSRSFAYVWPIGVVRSYAVAAYRMTHQGQKIGPKVQLASWQGIVSVAVSEAGGGSPTACFTIEDTMKFCTVNFGNDVGIIYGTVDPSPGVVALVLNPGEVATQTGGLRAIALDVVAGGTITLNDATFFGLFSTSTYEINATVAKSFHFFTTNATINIGDSTGDISYQGLAGGMQIEALGTQNLFRSAAYVDEMRFRDFDGSSDLTVFDHVGFASFPGQLTDQGGVNLIDSHISFFGAHYSAGSSNAINTRRGLFLPGVLTGAVAPRVAIGIELDQQGKNTSEEQWSFKSHHEDNWFYNRGQAIFGESLVVLTTLAAAAARGDAFIDVTDATGFATAGVIRAGFDDTNQLAIPFDRYFVYSSISLGGGAGGSDRINLTQDLTHAIADTTNVFQYTVPDEAQVEIWNGATARVGLIINATAAQSANLQEWRDDAGNVLLAVGPTGTLTGTIDSGTFSATATNLTNLDSASVDSMQWLRVGNTVTVSGQFTINQTTTLLPSSFEMDLPIASNLTGADLAGSAVYTNGDGSVASIKASGANDTALVDWRNFAPTGNGIWYYHFTYRII